MKCSFILDQEQYVVPSDTSHTNPIHIRAQETTQLFKHSSWNEVSISLDEKGTGMRTDFGDPPLQ